MAGDKKDQIDKDLEDTFGTAMDMFFPDGYEVPATGGNYMKFEPGENKFRILKNPIFGWELWIAKKPKRYPYNTPVPIEDADNADLDERTGLPRPAKHFWAMVVWNYKDKKVQVLEITQKGIQQSIKALMTSGGWGNPKGYDISVVKEGKGFETSYQVIPNPPKELSEEVAKEWEKLEDKVELEALYKGGDPFGA